MLDLMETTQTYLIHSEAMEISIAQVACPSAGLQQASLLQWGARYHFIVRHLWLMLAAARITEGPYLTCPCRFDHWEKSFSALAVENNYQLALAA
jgi:hypothetical protein